MLTLPEKIIFAIFALSIAGYAAWKTNQIIKVIRRGKGELKLDNLLKRVFTVTEIVVTQRTVLTLRLGASIMHALVAWGFTFYLLVNLGDALVGYIPGIHFMGSGPIGKKNPPVTVNDNALDGRLDQAPKAGILRSIRCFARLLTG